jgi:hypothetical protein
MAPMEVSSIVQYLMRLVKLKADIRLLGESDGQSHKHDRQAGDDEVQHEVDPQLDAEEEVKGSLGEVE